MGLFKKKEIKLSMQEFETIQRDLHELNLRRKLADTEGQLSKSKDELLKSLEEAKKAREKSESKDGEKK